MQRFPIIIFKILAMSLLLMFTLDTTLVLIDTVSVHSRMMNLSGVMVNEIARNNSMPESAREMFELQLQEVVNNSKVANSYSTNMSTNKVYNGETYTSLDGGNAKDYGELADLYIEVEMEPTKIYFNTDNPNNGGLLGKTSYKYKMVYTYRVPCLRYIR